MPPPTSSTRTWTRRNYGVGRYGRVFLFDYDAVEKLTDVKIRTNSDREPGEEAIPDWFFESGVDFPARGTRARHAAHEPLRAALLSGGELRSVDASSIGKSVQQKLLRGEVPGSQVYPDSCQARLRPRANGARHGALRQLEDEGRAAGRALRSRRARFRRAPARRARRCAGRNRGRIGAS